MRALPYGDRGLLVELADAAAVVAFADLARRDPATAELVIDVVPGARTVLLIARPGVPVDRLRAVVAERGRSEARQGVRSRPGPTRPEVVVPVVYDGPDLAVVAELTGLSPAEVVAAHSGAPWQVAFGGFAPGFAYLVGGDPRLHVPRLDRPRTAVPAGAVALAGEFSGIYPRSSPGGWRLVGRTDLVLWDVERDPPALLAAGTTVRFQAVG